MVPKLVETANRDRECGMPPGYGEGESALIGREENEYVFHVAIPAKARGKLIGPKGANIQQLRAETGAKVFVENESYDGHQAARIIGPPEVLVQALQLVNDIVQEQAGTEEFAEWADCRQFSGAAKGKGGDHRGGKDK